MRCPRPRKERQERPADRAHDRVRKFSDRLLELHAKAKCPEYRDKHEITGAGGGPVTLQVITGVPQPERM
jgi:hypothetical protein